MPVAVAVSEVVPPATQVIVTGSEASCPAGITTLPGETVAFEVSRTESATITPPGGAASDSRIRREVVCVAKTCTVPVGSKFMLTVFTVATVVVP